MNPNRPKGQGKPALEAITMVTFEEQGGPATPNGCAAASKTKLTIRLRFDSAAIRDALLKIGMNEGWSQSLERLASQLADVR